MQQVKESKYEEKGPTSFRDHVDKHTGERRVFVIVPITQRKSGRVIRKVVYFP